MKDFRSFLDWLQEIHKPWADYNFGKNRPAHQSLLGVFEELGEFKSSKSYDEQTDSIADCLIFAADHCNAMGWRLSDLWVDNHSDHHRDYVELVGNISHHTLKLEQGIRGSKEHHEQNIRQLLVTLFSKMFEEWSTSHKINSNEFKTRYECELDLIQEIRLVWDNVSRRDWHKNKHNGST